MQSEISSPTNQAYVKPVVDSLMFVMEIHILQTYLGIMLIERILIACSLAGKNMLLLEHIMCPFRETASTWDTN